MKVLIICSGNTTIDQKFDIKIHQSFVYEQVEALKKLGVEFDYFLIKSKGLKGYLKHYKLLLKTLKNNYDLIHAHNGMSGFLANLQSQLPVITTYHGSDINMFLLRIISYFPVFRSSQNIIVSKKQEGKLLFKRNLFIIPCGIDLSTFHPLPDWDYVVTSTNQERKRSILFSSSFSNPVKNYPLAFSAIEKLNSIQVELIELKNKTREEVCYLMNAVDLLIITSFSEGSPMVIKEAMACNCPIVSTDVGDVKEVIGDTQGCYLTSYDPEDVSHKIELALEFSRTKGRTNGRQRIKDLGLDSERIAGRILEVYKAALNS